MLEMGNTQAAAGISQVSHVARAQADNVYANDDIEVAQVRNTQTAVRDCQERLGDDQGPLLHHQGSAWQAARVC